MAASMFLDWHQLRDEYDATARAVLHAASAAVGTGERVATQGHVLAGDDLLGTLAVEATLHHLDLVAHLPGAPAPAPSAMRAAREVVDAVATDVTGLPFPSAWEDAVVLRVSTGREEADLSHSRRWARSPTGSRSSAEGGRHRGSTAPGQWGRTSPLTATCHPGVAARLDGSGSVG